MKIFLISNTLFGYKDITKTQLDYFNNIFIPYLKTNVRENDIMIHGGNIFNDKKNVNMGIINSVIDIFEKISNILPLKILKSKNDEISTLLLNRINNVEIIDNIHTIDNLTLVPYNIDINSVESNDIIIFNSEYNNNIDTYKNILKSKFNISICTNDNIIKDGNIINIGSPYQLNDKSTERKGFLMISPPKKKVKFILNKYSPIYDHVSINDITDINNIKINTNNYTTVSINENLLNEKEHVNKLNIFINNNNLKKIIYLKNNNNKTVNDIEYHINSNDFNIKTIIDEYLTSNNLNIKPEINNIYEIYEKKY